MRRLGLRLREERGIALVMAIGIMFALSLALISVTSFTSSNTRMASHSKAGQTSRTLADAGLNNSLSVLNAAYTAGVSFYVPGDLLPPRTTAYDGGSVTWSGEYCMGTVAAGSDCKVTDYGVWRLRSTGTVRNPTGPGASDVRRTLRARVPAYLPPETLPSSGLWNWVYSGEPAPDDSTCNMTLQQSVEVSSPLYVAGNLCLENTAVILQPPAGQKNRLVVGGRLWLMQNANSAGSSTNRLTEAHVVNGCAYKKTGFVVHVPCRGPDPTPTTSPFDADVDNVFVAGGEFYTTLPDPPISAPPLELDQWYKFAHPGPTHPCSGAPDSGTVRIGTPPTFDLNGTRDNSLDTTVIPPNTAPAAQNLTPPASYVCRTVAGELSWNHTTRVLTVAGPLYIDGSAYIDTSWAGNVASSYRGRAALTVSGTFLIKNSKMCAKLTSTGTGCDFAGWDPNATSDARALAIQAAGNGSLGGPQGQVCSGCGINVVNADFQGLLYATNDISIDTTSIAQGPMISPNSVSPGQKGNISFPPFTVLPTGSAGAPIPNAILAPPEEFGG